MSNKDKTTPWSPSVAREVVRRALCRYRTDAVDLPGARADEELTARLLENDRAFDSIESLLEATKIHRPLELRAFLRDFDCDVGPVKDFAGPGVAQPPRSSERRLLVLVRYEIRHGTHRAISSLANPIGEIREHATFATNPTEPAPNPPKTIRKKG